MEETINDLFESFFPDISLTSNGANTVIHIIRKFDLYQEDLVNALEILRQKEKNFDTSEDMFKYFLGILYNKGRGTKPFLEKKQDD